MSPPNGIEIFNRFKEIWKAVYWPVGNLCLNTKPDTV